ncbi:phosphotransferase [Endozoicomonas sp. Mp262]|uniref:aminoglycoside phosphotransferase family protein n=1 Tax=Endozoicomonas sp. Mp262 TaxID=2919499 RepID=UPI0021DB626F
MVTSKIEQLPELIKAHDRRGQLAAWVVEQLSTEQGTDGQLPLKAISNDASFRKYYRVQGPQGSLIAVDAPPETEDSAAFIAIAEDWRGHHINVPFVYAFDLEQGFMLLEDFGDCLLQECLNEQSVEDLYSQALKTLRSIQQLPAGNLPCYDEQLLRFELSLYPEWFLRSFLGLQLSDKEQRMLEELFDHLVFSALEQPKTTVHRDFHSRNLMLGADGELGVIDFQGALYGPLLYDPVSLLKDCYQCWPPEKVQHWLLNYTNGLSQLASVSSEQILKWFDWMGLQRHLKCLGIFSRLWIRDKKASYLGDLPTTFNYVLTACARYPELQEHAQWLEQRVMPLLGAEVIRIQEEVKA